MNIFLHELKTLRKTTAIWIIVLVSLLALYLSIYPGMANDAEDFKKLLEGYPASVRAMLGINLDTITSILGFYSMIFSFIVVFGAIQAMNLGVSILSRESRERTADFLLVKPVSRTSIVTAKLLAAFTVIIITNIIFLAVSFIMANMVKTADFDVKTFFLINLTLFFIQVIFLAIGMVSSVFFNKLKNILPLSLGVVFGLYMLGTLIATGKDVDIARYFSPFKYFDIPYIIKNISYESSYMITGIAIVIVSIIVSYIVYNKKDIHAV
ncbi:ABC transporter permease subunit [Clostridium sp. 'White wine YQ']|uniref:ABC transporter permease subunit n=1 Tax=Clostridium sp. 'White wine YQ' TaxID=3027474 RepID=UPI002365B41B|nr:ABC transporter permease subunit [Clostridium sp. 'White wine YQ']MDD7793335.1 ABC transporter permease subunit [Clostridium sp. 'White wine YQ']